MTEVRSGDGGPAPFVPDEYDRVIVASTARSHGTGVRRLPDRRDHYGLLAAVQVETSDDAASLLASLDRPNRRIFIDIEPKQDVDLLRVAAGHVQQASIQTLKPNDSTVDATEAVMLHHYGNDLGGLSCAVYGTGNLGFKIALRLAERRVSVRMAGRSQERVAAVTASIRAILPRHATQQVEVHDGGGVDALITAVTADGVISEAWLDRLRPEALILDVGINNLSAGFIIGALERGHTCQRLDVRAAPYPVPPPRNRYFEDVVGRAELAGVRIVAGGLIGQAGEVVVDQVSQPTRVIGVANGTGGLLAPDRWSPAQREEVMTVAECIDQAGA